MCFHTKHADRTKRTLTAKRTQEATVGTSNTTMPAESPEYTANTAASDQELR